MPVRVKTTSCLYCGHMIDHAGEISIKSAVPEVGDFTLCIMCAGLMVFVDDYYTLKIPDPEDLKRMYKDRRQAMDIFKASWIILNMNIGDK